MFLPSDEAFLNELAERHGVHLEQSDLDILKACDAARDQEKQRTVYYLDRAEDLWITKADLTSGKFLKVGIAAAIGGFSGGTGAFSLLGAGLAAGASLVQTLLTPDARQQREDERFDQSFGIESGGKLAPAGTSAPMVYGSRSTDPNGGVRVGGILIHSRIETKLGTNTLYQLYVLSLGQSPQLGWGQIGQIDDDETLFNKQPRSNFTLREIEGFNREGFQAQTAINPEFPFYSQVLTPPDYAVFGIDLRGSVGTAQGLTIDDFDNAVNVNFAGSDIIKDPAAGAVWNAGAFSSDGLDLGGLLQFTTGNPLDIKAAGLSNADPDQDWVSIEHGFYWDGSGNVFVAESGATVAGPFISNAADLMRLQITPAGGIEYYINGTLIYTSAIVPALPLFADIALFSTTASFQGVTTSTQPGGIPPAGGSVTQFTLEDEDDHELYDPAEDYTLCNGPTLYQSDNFRIIAKDSTTHTITTDSAVPLQGGSQIYAYWTAKYEDTKRVNQTWFNLEMRVSSREGNQDADNYGDLKVHVVAFDLFMRPVTDPLGSEQFIARFMVRSKNPSPIRRGFRVINKALGRYYHEIRPLCAMPCDQKVYELTDSGDCTVNATGVVLAGQEIQIEAEVVLAHCPPPPPEIIEFEDTGDLQDNGDGSLTIVLGGPFANNCATTAPTTEQNQIEFPCPDFQYVGSISLGAINGVQCSISFAAGQYTAGGITDMCAPGDIFTIRPKVGTTLGGVFLGDMMLSDCGLTELTPGPFQIEVCVGQGTSPPITVSEATEDNCETINTEMNYEAKQQISSEQGPTGRIASVCEIVEPNAINIPLGGGINSYPGLALQGYKFLASERLRQPPGTRTLIREGRIIPNLMAAGDASVLSSPGNLNDPTAEFIADGITNGWVIRNLTLAPCYVEFDNPVGGNTPTLTVPEHSYVIGDSIDLYLFDPVNPGSVQYEGRYTVTGIAATAITLNNIFGGPSTIGQGYVIKAKFSQVTGFSETTIETAEPIPWSEKDRYLLYFLGSSPYFPDIFADLVANDFGGLRAIVDPDEYIDYESLVRSRKFCVAQQYFWNGVFEKPQAFQKAGTTECIGSRLLPYKRDGRVGLVPDEMTEPVFIFNAANSRETKVEWADWQEQILNRLIVRYTDGRDEFTQDGIRFRQKTITIWNPDAYNGAIEIREETLDLEHVSGPQQAIDVGVTYFKSKTLQTKGISLETSYHAAFIDAGQIIRVQHPALEVGEEISGFVMEVGPFNNGSQQVKLDCQPKLAYGYATGTNPAGVFSTQTDFTETAIAIGDLLINETSGENGLITGIAENEIQSSIAVNEDDCYCVLNLTPPVGLLGSVTYREDGTTQQNIDFLFIQVGDEVWIEFNGLTQPLQRLDPVSLGGEDSLYRVQEVKGDGKASYQINGTFHPGAELYERTGLIIEWDDETEFY